MSKERVFTDKELLDAFREQFNTGHLYTESNVLVLMGMARGEERKIAQGSGHRAQGKSILDYQCPYTEESCIGIDTGDMSKIDCRSCPKCDE